MKEVLPAIVYLICCSDSPSNITVVDFETDSTSATHQIFGSSLEATFTDVIANPDVSILNPSAMVGRYIKPDGAQTWAGAFADTEIPFDLTVYSKICIKIWFNEPGNLAFKLESSATGGDNWFQTQQVTNTQIWEELCYDVSLPSEEDPFQPASGHVYPRSVLFFGYGSTVTGDAVEYFFDDIVLSQ